MPTITGLTVEQARSALAAAGVTPREFAANPNGACDVPADETTLRPGTLCIQYPVAGAQTFATVSVSYVVEADSYEAGGQGSGRWRRMPDLLGKQIDDATKLLAQGQLTLADHFDVEEVDSPDCAGGVVCETYPRPRMRKVLARRGRITIGRKQVSTPPSSPTTPSSTAPTTQPTQSESFF